MMQKTREVLSAVFRSWQRYHISLMIAALLIIWVVFIGLHDRGMILGYLATTIILLELTYRWRKIRYFFILLLASFVGSIFLSFLHEVVVSPLVRILLGAGALNSTGFHIFSDTVSLIIIFFGVMGVVIGVVGMAILVILRLVNLVNRDRTASST
ncbi:MAG: hypothetical protein ABR958_09180 [Dehalococcoidales bacterium]